MVVSAKGVGEHLQRHDPHLDLVHVGEAFAGGGGEVEGGVQGANDGLGGLFQVGEIVAIALDDVAHPVGGGHGAGPRQVVFGPFERRQIAQSAPAEIGAIEAQDAFGHAGGVFRHLGQFVPGDAEITKQLIGEDFAEAGGAGLVARPGQGSQVEVVGFGEFQQDLGRDRPLVAFEQVEVAGRNAQILRHSHLGHAQVAAQTFQSRAQKEFPLSLAGHYDELSHIDKKCQVSFLQNGLFADTPRVFVRANGVHWV